MDRLTEIDLARKKELIGLMGDVFRKLTLRNGQTPFSRLDEATLQTQQKITGDDVVVTCPIDSNSSYSYNLKNITFQYRREIDKFSFPVYSDWHIIFPKILTSEQNIVLEELEEKLRHL